MPTEPILQTVDLKKYYQQGEYVTKALDGVSLSVNAGEFVAVVGTSGSGKSTLLHMLGGLDTPTSGEVIIGGKRLSKKSEEQMAVFRRRHIGFIFQNYNLVPILNVYENIVLPMQLDGRKADKVSWKRSSAPWASRISSRTSPTTSPAASSSVSPSPGPCSRSRKSSWPTSPQAIYS